MGHRRQKKYTKLEVSKAGHRPSLRAFCKHNNLKLWWRSTPEISSNANKILEDNGYVHYRAKDNTWFQHKDNFQKWSRNTIGYMNIMHSGPDFWFTSNEYRIMFILRWTGTNEVIHNSPP